jgi:hypothetical protein
MGFLVELWESYSISGRPETLAVDGFNIGTTGTVEYKK